MFLEYAILNICEIFSSPLQILYMKGQNPLEEWTMMNFFAIL